MPKSDHDLEIEKLESHFRRIDEYARDFKNRGAFSEEDSATLQELQARRAAIHQKLEKAVHEGHLWATLKNELELDIESLIEELTRWEGRLDADTMRSRQQ